MHWLGALSRRHSGRSDACWSGQEAGRRLALCWVGLCLPAGCKPPSHRHEFPEASDALPGQSPPPLELTWGSSFRTLGGEHLRELGPREQSRSGPPGGLPHRSSVRVPEPHGGAARPSVPRQLHRGRHLLPRTRRADCGRTAWPRHRPCALRCAQMLPTGVRSISPRSLRPTWASRSSVIACTPAAVWMTSVESARTRYSTQRRAVTHHYDGRGRRSRMAQVTGVAVRVGGRRDGSLHCRRER